MIPLARERLGNLEAMLEADVPRGRLALGSLLDEKRLRVHPDGRIEGRLAVRGKIAA
jgi:hypothetical protein